MTLSNDEQPVCWYQMRSDLIDDVKDNFEKKK